MLCNYKFLIMKNGTFNARIIEQMKRVDTAFQKTKRSKSGRLMKERMVRETLPHKLQQEVDRYVRSMLE